MTEAITSKAHRYQRWSGELNKGYGTWLIIVATGIHLTLKEARTRILVLTAGGLMIGTCVLFGVLSYLEGVAGGPEAEGFYDFVRVFIGVDLSGIAQLGELRTLLWRSVFILTIKVQLVWVLLVVARVGPGLIAKDLKSRALPIYFAKPVTPLTYLAGKWLVVASFIAAVTLIPNLLSLIIGSLITGGLQTWGETLSLGVDLLLSGLMVCVIGGALVLALSSLTSDHRYVAVGWLALCTIPMIAQGIINANVPADAATGWLGCISLRDNIVILTERLFAIREGWEGSPVPRKAFQAALARPVEPVYAMIVLAGWTAGAFLLCYKRVVKFSRSASNV